MSLTEINQLYNSIESIDNLQEKNNMISRVNEMIVIEKDKLNKQLDTINDNKNEKNKIPIKYKKYSIDELEAMLYNTCDIDEKINIYYTIKLMVFNLRNTYLR